MERDPAEVLSSIGIATGHEHVLVETVVVAIRTVVDDLLADSNVVVLDQVILSFGDSPTRRALVAQLASSDPVPESVTRLQHDAVAAWLGVDWDVYTACPLANRSLIGMEVLDLLGDTAPDRPAVWDILEAWDASFADGRAYKVSSTGLEAALERWLIDNLDRLDEYDLPVTLAHQQKVLPNGKRPDLLCRFTKDTADAKAGDWLVIELKSTRYYAAAAEQIAGYVEQVAKHLAAPGEQVLALLITDGANHSEVEDLNQRGIGHLSLAALGYRLALAQQSAPMASAALSVPVSSVADMNSLTSEDLLLPESEVDGPTGYGRHLYPDVDSGQGHQAHREEVAATLWTRREERRRRYQHEWGDPAQWPAQHPTTVIRLDAPTDVSAAVCVRCLWIASAAGKSNEVVDLQAEAKAHAVGHPHDSALDRGENPPRPSRHVPGLAKRMDEARANARRAARRVDLREGD